MNLELKKKLRLTIFLGFLIVLVSATTYFMYTTHYQKIINLEAQPIKDASKIIINIIGILLGLITFSISYFSPNAMKMVDKMADDITIQIHMLLELKVKAEDMIDNSELLFKKIYEKAPWIDYSEIYSEFEITKAKYSTVELDSLIDSSKQMRINIGKMSSYLPIPFIASGISFFIALYQCLGALLYGNASNFISMFQWIIGGLITFGLSIYGVDHVSRRIMDLKWTFTDSTNAMKIQVTDVITNIEDVKNKIIDCFEELEKKKGQRPLTSFISSISDVTN